ncbi:MAG: hypothetical protein Q4A13_03875 [Fretibacterium sp.]|nr:hypothetical protein [Fretibacterium sp.]
MGSPFRKAAGTAAILCLLLSGTEARANYRFDDLFGPSGVGAQWMVITGGTNTVGDAASVPLEVKGEIVSGRSSVRIDNGRSKLPPTGEENRDIHTMFLVLTGTQASMRVNFAPPNADSITPDALLDNAVYSARKTPLGNGGYEFLFDKSAEQGRFGSVRGNFIYHQNPTSAYPSTPSQSLVVPFVIANVADGTAETEPLLLRAALREPGAAGAGDMTAYDRFTWSVRDNMTAGDSQWVFVPVPAWPAPDRILYRLTTEVTNHTGIRYAVQRFDNYAWNRLNPAYWAFDLPRAQSLKDLPARFRLDDISHVAPGLKTVYNQNYNVNEGMKAALRLHPVDPAAGFRELTLNHRIVFGLDLGTVEAPISGRTPYAWKVTAFNPRAAGTNFLKDVADSMKARSVKVPEGRTLTSGTARFDYVAGDAISSFAVNASIPGSVRREEAHREGTEGLLPLHVTFNLPRTHLLVAPKWDALLQQWHDTGEIRNDFAHDFSVYLRSGAENDLDLIQELVRQGVYEKLVKVFLDEQRGVVTVSFIAMLMDGTRDGSRPALQVVSDRTPVTDNDFLVLRDGISDDRWKLTFYVAPAGFRPNGPPEPKKPDEKSGGNGCNGLGLGVLALLAVAGLIRKGR